MLKRVSNVLTGIVLGIIVVCIVILAIPTLVNLNMYNVNNTNMEPSIDNGSIIFVKVTTDVVKDDIIAYRSVEDAKIVLTTRVSELNENNTIQAKSDNSENGLHTIDNSQVIGTVKLDIPILGYLVEFIQTPVGIFFGALLLTIMVALGVLSELIDQKDKDIELNSELDIKIISYFYRLYKVYVVRSNRVKRAILEKVRYFPNVTSNGTKKRKGTEPA